MSFIDFKTAQELSSVYGQQEFVLSTAMRVYRSQSLAIAPVFITGDPNQMTAPEIQTFLERSADLLLDLRGLEQALIELDKEYLEEAKTI